ALGMFLPRSVCHPIRRIAQKRCGQSISWIKRPRAALRVAKIRRIYDTSSVWDRHRFDLHQFRLLWRLSMAPRGMLLAAAGTTAQDSAVNNLATIESGGIPCTTR